MMATVESAVQSWQHPARAVVGLNRQDIRSATTPQTTVHHKRVKSLESSLHEFAAETTTAFTVVQTSSPAAELQVQALQRELDRTHLVYSELLSAQDAEILRLRELLSTLGVDGDGNPLPTGADAVDTA